MPNHAIFNERPESQDRALKVLEKLGYTIVPRSEAEAALRQVWYIHGYEPGMGLPGSDKNTLQHVLHMVVAAVHCPSAGLELSIYPFNGSSYYVVHRDSYSLDLK